MVRVQVQLTEEQVAALRELAANEGLSVAHVVREAVDLLLRERCGPTREEMVKRSLAAVGMFRSGTGDLSDRHDEYSAEAQSCHRRSFGDLDRRSAMLRIARMTDRSAAGAGRRAVDRKRTCGSER